MKKQIVVLSLIAISAQTYPLSVSTFTDPIKSAYQSTKDYLKGVYEQLSPKAKDGYNKLKAVATDEQTKEFIKKYGTKGLVFLQENPKVVSTVVSLLGVPGGDILINEALKAYNFETGEFKFDIASWIKSAQQVIKAQQDAKSKDDAKAKEKAKAKAA